MAADPTVQAVLDQAWSSVTKELYSNIFYGLAASSLQQSIFVDASTLLQATVIYDLAQYWPAPAQFQIKPLALMKDFPGFPDMSLTAGSATALIVSNPHYQQILEILTSSAAPPHLPKQRLLIQVTAGVTRLQVEDLVNSLTQLINSTSQSITNIQDQIDEASSRTVLLNIFFYISETLSPLPPFPWARPVQFLWLSAFFCLFVCLFFLHPISCRSGPDFQLLCPVDIIHRQCLRELVGVWRAEGDWPDGDFCFLGFHLLIFFLFLY